MVGSTCLPVVAGKKIILGATITYKKYHDDKNKTKERKGMCAINFCSKQTGISCCTADKRLPACFEKSLPWSCICRDSKKDFV
jgi:hypothetical protein